jgi:hypothetical protein
MMSARNFSMKVFSLVAIILALLSLKIAQPVSAGDFTIIVLPDTQFYSKSYPAIFSSQTQWIVDNKDTLNIAYVAHVGDIVDSYDQTPQWDNARTAMSLLEDTLTTGLTDGIPYGLVPGNHDEPTGNYNYYFGVPHFQGRGYYGGGYPPGSNDNNYTLFSAGGMDFIVINLEYLSPAAGVLEWADSLLKTYASRRAIVVSHYLLNLDATWGPWGQQIYDALKDNPNLFLMLSGHIHGESRRVDVYNGTTVNTLLADYQSLANGGNGWLRLLKFSPASDEISVTTYSPYLKQYDTDTNSQFLLYYDMGGTNTISFQDGVWPSSDYFGTRDTVLSQSAPSSNFGSDLALYVDGDDPPGSGKDLSTLLYWDISAIPPGSAVKGASIALNVFNKSGQSYQVYEMKRNWVESQSTWNSNTSGQEWETPGALGLQDRGSTVLGSLSPSSTGSYVINPSGEGVALIQSWVDNPAGNHGFIIANSSSSDGADFDSREVSTVSNRPTLTVRYSSDQSGNHPPVADQQSVTTNEDTAKAITLTANDGDGDTLTYAIVTSPTHGTLSGTLPNITYTPAANYNGSDSFTFKANDGQVASNIATVSITVNAVNDAPVANSQSVTTNQNTAKAITLNATDVDGDALTYAIVTSPTHGTLSGTLPNVTYTPAANYNGSDSFTFQANDGKVDSNIATVSITVSLQPSNSNLALNKPATADSEQTSLGNTANKGNDGNSLTRWSANDGRLNHWWKVDLGGTYTLTGTKVQFQFARNYRYKIEVSADNINWTTLVNRTTTTSTAQTRQDSFSATSGRYVRITYTGLPWYPTTWASHYEFQVYGN